MTSNPLSYLVLGELRRDYLITPDQKVLPDQLGGSLLYAAEGVGLWLEEGEKVGLIARVGEDYPREWFERIVNRGYDVEGIKVLAEEIDLRFFRAYTDLRTYSDEDPVGHFCPGCCWVIPAPKKLPIYRKSLRCHSGSPISQPATRMQRLLICARWITSLIP